MTPAEAGKGVLLIGAGRMGGALLKGWLGSGRFGAVHVVEPRASDAIANLAVAKTITLRTTFDPALHSDLSAVVVALKPQVLKGESAMVAGLGKTGALILSIAAGIPVRFFSAAAPEAAIVRAMPNTPGAIGRGITALCAGAGVSESGRGLAESLMAPLGETLWLDDESLMDAVTAVSGSGPAYVFLLAEALAEAGRAQGLTSETAERLARATITGAGALLDADSRPPAELRREVTSPGGTTQAALDILMGKPGMPGMEDLMTRAVDAAAKRGKELGR